MRASSPGLLRHLTLIGLGIALTACGNEYLPGPSGGLPGWGFGEGGGDDKPVDPVDDDDPGADDTGTSGAGGGDGGVDTGGDDGIPETDGSDIGDLDTGGADTGGTDTGADGDTGGSDTGSDPDPDSDGDGQTDGEEQSAGTDPDDYYSRAYSGGYLINTCSPRPAATGPTGVTTTGPGTRVLYEQGDIANDLSLYDQHGELVDLASFCGNDILLVFGPMWCEYTQAVAPYLQPLQDEWADEGVTVIMVLLSNEAGWPATQSDLQSWATTYGMTTVPVLAATRGSQWMPYQAYWRSPSYTHLDPGLVVDSVDEYEVDPATW